MFILILFGYLFNGIAIAINGTQTLALIYMGEFAQSLFRVTILMVNILCIYALRVCQKDKCEQ